MAKVIHSRTYYTPTGRKRVVEVQEKSFGGYEVVNYHYPKDGRSLIWGTYYGNFTNKAKAIRKANSLARK